MKILFAFVTNKHLSIIYYINRFKHLESIADSQFHIKVE